MDRISARECSQIFCAKSREEMARIAGKLCESGSISATERDELISAVSQDLLSGRSAEAEEKERLSTHEVEFYTVRNGSPAVQGGLPSLGKRRP